MKRPTRSLDTVAVRPEVRHDLSGDRRLVTEARGIQYTIVNGKILFEAGQRTRGFARTGIAMWRARTGTLRRISSHGTA
jgi:hypothetical protein